MLCIRTLVPALSQLHRPHQKRVVSFARWLISRLMIAGRGRRASTQLQENKATSSNE
jgi:hypothetical protein